MPGRTKKSGARSPNSSPAKPKRGIFVSQLLARSTRIRLIPRRATSRAGAFGSRIFHVHAKDAHINRGLLMRYGICHPGVAEHRFPGIGQANWAEIIHSLLRAGYDSDLNIEGWHDPVFRDSEGTLPADIKL